MRRPLGGFCDRTDLSPNLEERYSFPTLADMF